MTRQYTIHVTVELRATAALTAGAGDGVILAMSARVGTAAATAAGVSAWLLHFPQHLAEDKQTINIHCTYV